MRAHADADQRNLADVVGGAHALGAEVGGHALDDLVRAIEVVAVHGEGEVGRGVGRDVLHDHVDLDVGVADRAEDRRGDAGAVGDADHGDLRLVAVEGDA